MKGDLETLLEQLPTRRVLPVNTSVLSRFIIHSARLTYPTRCRLMSTKRSSKPRLPGNTSGLVVQVKHEVSLAMATPRDLAVTGRPEEGLSAIRPRGKRPMPERRQLAKNLPAPKNARSKRPAEELTRLGKKPWSYDSTAFVGSIGLPPHRDSLTPAAWCASSYIRRGSSGRSFPFLRGSDDTFVH